MTSPATTPAPTLPADWEPTSPGCLQSEDYWIWLYNAALRDARTVLGGPSQTTECFASPWNPTITYTGSGCPPHYTSACHNTEFGAVTCCPDTYEFECQTASYRSGIHGEWFRCISAYASQDTASITITQFSSGKIDVQNRTRHKYEHLFALGLMYTTPTPSPTSFSTSSLATRSSTTPNQHQPEETTPNSPSPSDDKTSGLTTGAAAGIGVGATVGVILFILLAWFLYRRRKAALALSSSALSSSAPTPGVLYSPMQASSPGPSPYSLYPVQLEDTPPPKEMAAEGFIPELQGSLPGPEGRSPNTRDYR